MSISAQKGLAGPANLETADEQERSFLAAEEEVQILGLLGVSVSCIVPPSFMPNTRRSISPRELHFEVYVINNLPQLPGHIPLFSIRSFS